MKLVLACTARNENDSRGQSSANLVPTTTYVTLTAGHAVPLHVSTYNIHMFRHEATVTTHVLWMVFLHIIIHP